METAMFHGRHTDLTREYRYTDEHGRRHYRYLLNGYYMYEIREPWDAGATIRKGDNRPWVQMNTRRNGKGRR
jgi:hypothetical protein